MTDAEPNAAPNPTETLARTPRWKPWVPVGLSTLATIYSWFRFDDFTRTAMVGLGLLFVVVFLVMGTGQAKKQRDARVIVESRKG